MVGGVRMSVENTTDQPDDAPHCSNELVHAGMDALWSQHKYHSIETDVRAVLAVVLPIHEQEVRDRIAAELRAVTFPCPNHADTIAAFDSRCIRCQRYTALIGAQRIIAGRESTSAKAVREMRQGPDGVGDGRRPLSEEHDEDVRAVAEACAGVVDGTAPQPIRHEYAVRRLRKRFAARIADVERRDAARAKIGP
jgi:hypothetical protein